MGLKEILRRAALVVNYRRVLPWVAMILIVAGLVLASHFWQPDAEQGPVEAAESVVPPDIEGHWSGSEVALLTQLGVAEIDTEGRFRPEDAITRAEMVKMLVRAFGVAEFRPVDEGREVLYAPSEFTDVSEEHWVIKYLNQAQHIDLIAGYEDQTFRPDAGITRAEMAGLFHRIFEEPEPDGDDAYTFSDADEIPDWARPAVMWNAETGLFHGFPDDSFRSNTRTTRAQAAVLIKRALKLRGALYNLQGEVAGIDEQTGEVALALPDDQVVTLSLEGVRLVRGDSEIDPDLLRSGEYLHVVLNAAGEPISASAPHTSFTAILESQSLTHQTLEVRPLYPADGESASALDSWANVAFLSAAGQPERVSRDDPAAVYWDGRTQFYRQGISARAYELRPGDRLNIVLWPDGPVVRHVDAVRYDCWGTVEHVGSLGASDSVTVRWRDDDGDLAAGEVTPNTRVEAGGRSVDAAVLTEDAFVGVVHARGSTQISYMEVYGADDAAAKHDSGALAWEYRRGILPEGQGRPTGSDASIPGPVDAVLAAEEIEGEGYEQPAAPSNSEVIGADDLQGILDVDGNGVVVAVVDTGVDPLTPGLFAPSGGSADLVDWRDFTGDPSSADRASGGSGTRLAEGDVVTREEVRIEGGTFYFDGEEFTIEGPEPPERTMRCGWVRSDFFVPGRADGERVLVAAASIEDGGGYDSVYVDVQGDGVLRETDLFRPVYDGGRAGTILFDDTDGPGVNFVITEIEPDGRLVNLGFDGSGHGTQVAGVIAAAETDRDPGGIAPGVDMMALKALSSDGSGSWFNVMRAVEYAAVQGADVINVSVTGMHDLSSGSTLESRRLAEIAQEHDVLIVTAVGNTGPGLATAYTPGDPRWTLSVGAAAVPEVVLRDYGYSLPEVTVWEYSSMGPRADGGLAPSVLAPGSIYTPLPERLAPSERKFFEGTSCAAGHVSGTAALMVQAARERELPYTMLGIKRAIEEGAQKMDDYLPVEQGFGTLDAFESWLSLRRDPAGESKLELALDSGVMVERPLSEMDPRGVYLRDYIPGGLSVFLRNQGDAPSGVSISTEGMNWALPASRGMEMPGNAEMDLSLSYDLPSGPTVLSGFLTVDDERTPGVDDRLLHTIVRPEKLQDQTSLQEKGELGAGMWRRYFVHVPEGVSHLRAEVGVPDPEAGRVYLQIVDPHGEQVHVSPHVGAGSRGRWGDERLHTSRIIEWPQVGVWEIIVSSASSLSFYGLESSEFDFSVDVLPRGSLALVPEQTEWRFARPETAPGSLQARVRIDTGDDDTALLGDLQPLGVGLVNSPEELQVLPRQRLEGTSEEFRYSYFEVPDNTSALNIWSGNPSQEDVLLEMLLYRESPDGRMEEVETESGGDREFLRVRNPSPGEYMLATRPDSTERCDYEVMVEAWPAVWDVQVNGPVIGRGGAHELAVRMEIPPRTGSYWALVGLQTADGLPVARTWMQVEVGAGSVLFSSQPVVNSVSPLRVAVRDAETLRPAGGVVSLNDQLYTLDEDGIITIPSVDPQDRLNHFEVRYNSGEDDWSPPVRLAASGLSDEQLASWRQSLMRAVAGGRLDNPLIHKRWENFFYSPPGTSSPR